MKRVIWGRKAEREIRGIITYYARLAPDLPEQLIERIDRAAAQLIDHPRLGPELPDSNLRKWHAIGTPFLLFYRPTRDGVRIVRVRDARSDWKLR